MTPDINALRKLLAEATPGTWRLRHLSDGEPIVVMPDSEDSTVLTEANAALIVAAVNALPALLSRLERLEAVAEAARVIWPRTPTTPEVEELCHRLADLDAEETP